MAIFFFLIHVIWSVWQAFLSLFGKGNLIDRNLAGWDGGHSSLAGEQQCFCPICQEPLRETVSTNCGHIFCRACLVQHAKTSASQLCCPTCRKPCSEVLRTGCLRHQKKVRYFCEESGLLLCEECKKSTDHQSHREQTIQTITYHYKKRLNLTIKKFKKIIRKFEHRTSKEKDDKVPAEQVHGSTHRLEIDLDHQSQTKRLLDLKELHLKEQEDQLEDIPAEVPRMIDIAKNMIADIEKMVKELDASKLKDAKELLHRSASIYFELKKKSK